MRHLDLCKNYSMMVYKATAQNKSFGYTVLNTIIGQPAAWLIKLRIKHQMRLGELELWGEIRQSVCVKEIRISYKNGQFLGQNAQSHFCIIRLPQLSSGSMIQSYMTDINIAVCDEGSQITERNLCKNLTSNKHIRF